MQLPWQPQSGLLLDLFCGLLCYELRHSAWVTNSILLYGHEDEIFGALVVGLSMFLMVTTQSEHPPAAAFSLGLVLHPWTSRTIIITFMAILLALMYRKLFSKFMIDLL